MTIRQFKFTGSNNDATGTITLGGTQVLNGAFTGDSTSGSVIFAGSIDVNDTLAIDNDILVPTIITVTSGSIFVALTQWNYSVVNNPAYSEEQLTVINDQTIPFNPTKLAIGEEVANPPLSTADIAVLQSTDPLDDELKSEIIKIHNLSVTVQDPSVFDWGVTPDEDACNRTNVLLDGVEPAGANTNIGILVTAGQTLTYDSIVFASNIYNVYPYVA